MKRLKNLHGLLGYMLVLLVFYFLFYTIIRFLNDSHPAFLKLTIIIIILLSPFYVIPFINSHFCPYKNIKRLMLSLAIICTAGILFFGYIDFLKNEKKIIDRRSVPYLYHISITISFYCLYVKERKNYLL